jgi:hypothetical protein
MQVYSKLLAARKISLYRFQNKSVCNDINNAELKFPQCAYMENNIPFTQCGRHINSKKSKQLNTQHKLDEKLQQYWYDII